MTQPVVDLSPQARSRFLRWHGRPATSVALAPGRVNVVGEHTDYLGGRCLPLALPYATWVALDARTDDQVRLTSGTTLRWRGDTKVLQQPPPLVPGWQAYVLGALRAVGWRGGVDLHVESSVPWGAGLSSSAAVICAVAVAASPKPVPDLLPACLAAEQLHVGAPTGGMDQTVALLAEAGHALALDFSGGGAPAATPVPWRPGSAGLELVVVDTGVRHANADGTFGQRRREAEMALALDTHQVADAPDPLPRRRRHVETENARVLEVVDAARAGDWRSVGLALTASHVSLRDDHEVSSPELDRTVEAALATGAWGARMTGGGFGGCAVVLLPRSLRRKLCEALTRSAAQAGHPEPTFLRADASGPARRLDPRAPEQRSAGHLT